MFDITSSKLLILGIVALLVIGPKDLPALLRTIGKYVGIIKRQAAEFRAQFDEAMRESELARAEEVGGEHPAGDRGFHARGHVLGREAARRCAPERRCGDGGGQARGRSDRALPDGPPTVAALGRSTEAPAELNGASHPAEAPAAPRRRARLPPHPPSARRTSPAGRPRRAEPERCRRRSSPRASPTTSPRATTRSRRPKRR